MEDAWLGCVLHRIDEDWLAVCQNIGRARQVWGLLREVAEDRGNIPDKCRKFLLIGGPSGASFWVGNIGLDSNDAAKTRWGTYGFLEAGEGGFGA